MTGIRPTMLVTLPNRPPARKALCACLDTTGPNHSSPGRDGPDRQPSGSTSYEARRGPRRAHRGDDWNDQVDLGYRPRVRAIRRFTVRPVLPPPLSALGDLAGNLRWSWHPPTQDVFAEVDPEIWESTKRDPVRLLGAVNPERLEDLASDQGFLDRLGSAKADLDAYLGRRAVVQPQGRRRGAHADRLLLPGVRHHRRAAAVLRRPRHPGRRPPQGGQRPRRTPGRRRPAVPRGLLQAVPVARGLAAREVPRARSRRAADLAAAGGERRARHHLHRDARRPRAAGQDLGRPGRPRAAAAARLRRRGQPRPLPRGDRPAVRRHLGAPSAAGDPARHRRRPRPARPRPDHRRHGARGVPHQRGTCRVPRPGAHPRADRRRGRAEARLPDRARGLPGLHRLHHPHARAGRDRPVLAGADRAVLRHGRAGLRRTAGAHPGARRGGLRRRRPDRVQHGGDGLPAGPARERRVEAARTREPGDVPRLVAGVRRGRGADHVDHERRARADVGGARGVRPGRSGTVRTATPTRSTRSGTRSTRRRPPTSGRSSVCCASGWCSTPDSGC